MSYEKISIHPLDLESRKNLLKRHTPNIKEHEAILDHLRLLANGEITGKNVGERRQVKLIDMFALFFKHCKKQSSILTKEDLRKFKEDLFNDKIRKENGNAYSDETKEDCTETIVRYLEVKYPEKMSKWASPTMPFRKWFVIRATKKTPEYLSEDEIEKLYQSTKTIEGKFIIAGLFDSGARIEEFLNIRFEDIEKPTINFPYYKIDFKEEYSKTEGRKIGMYWKHSTEAISKYLELIEKKDIKQRIIESEYDALRMYLMRLGKKVLGKRLHPHLIRKSSATYYADKLNRQQLCVRFGWKFSSEMPDIYISRAGVDEGKVKEVRFNDDLNVMKKDNSELNTKSNLMREEIDLIKKELIQERKESKEKFEILLRQLKGYEELQEIHLQKAT